MVDDFGGELREILARNVRSRRQMLGLSQEALGGLAGLHRTYIGAVERSERNLSVDNIERLARALGVPPEQLLSKPDGAAAPGST